MAGQSGPAPRLCREGLDSGHGAEACQGVPERELSLTKCDVSTLRRSGGAGHSTLRQLEVVFT
jgi:hypothetical protein